MGLWNFITGQNASSAKVADGRLILSMPDAETPVIWVMELDDGASSVIRLENDKQGNNILKKYGGKGAAETVAVYRNRNKAESALAKISCALEKARNSRVHVGPNAQPVIIRPASLPARIFTAFLYLWFIVYLGSSLSGYLTAIEQSAGLIPQNTQAAATIGPVNETGVPQSADDFLKQAINPIPAE
ncbi:MAG: hypothetical protein KGQ41_02315 [Alphaproteobacteria bacterium]|nr:hypothetical protein [Alphaproteobacteria bacterium]